LNTLVLDLTFAALAALDSLAVAALGYQLLGGRRRVRTGTSAREAYSSLIAGLTRLDPGTPVGLTPREAVARAERLGLGVDWERVQEELVEYEKGRFGRRGEGPVVHPETSKAATRVWRMA